MAELTASNSWSVYAAVDPASATTFYGAHKGVLDPSTVSPVEQLLVAVGACLGQTCIALMKFHRMPESTVRIRVDGHKPAGPLDGKGLDKIRISIAFDTNQDRRQRDRLLTDAKKLCTVSNSLSSDIALVVEAVDQAITL